MQFMANQVSLDELWADEWQSLLEHLLTHTRQLTNHLSARPINTLPDSPLIIVAGHLPSLSHSVRLPGSIVPLTRLDCCLPFGTGLRVEHKQSEFFASFEMIPNVGNQTVRSELVVLLSNLVERLMAFH